MTDLIRGTALQGYRELVRSLGADPDVLLRAAHIDPAAAGDHDRFVTYSALAVAIGTARNAVARPDFPLLLAQHQGISILGPIAVVMRHSETVGDALDGASRYLHTYSPAVGVRLERGHQPLVSFSIHLRRLAYRSEMVELSLGITVEVIRLLIGADFVPPRVTFQHTALSPQAAYLPLFGPTVSSGQSRNAVHLPPSIVTARLSGIDARAREIAEHYLTPIRAHRALPDHVHELVTRLMPLGQATLLDVATVLSTHPRALQRELASQGTSFETILDQARRTTAWSLSATGMTGAQISIALGYSEQSSFSRACRRWFDTSPRELSRRRRANPAETAHSEP